MDAQNRKEVWTDFWNEENRNSCAAGLEDRSSEITLFWSKCADSISSGEQVLDLCTGKGAVITLLLELESIAHDTLPSYAGLDLSSYDINLVLEKFKNYSNRTSFYLSTSVEKMTFEDQSFDVLTSQFGLEYTLTEKALANLFRVLKPGGKLFFVTHHADSIIADIAKSEIEQINVLLSRDGFVDLLYRMIPFFALLNRPDGLQLLRKNPDATSVKKAFNLVSSVLQESVDGNGYSGMFEEALNISNFILNAARNTSEDYAKSLLDNYKKELLASNFRALEVLECALNLFGTDELIKRIRNYGKHSIQRNELKNNGAIVAWSFEVS